MSISQQRLVVAAAEREVRKSREDAAQINSDLKQRAKRRWLPAAILGLGAGLGFWIDARLRLKTAGSEPAQQPSTTAPVSTSLGMLATLSMLLKLWHDVAPIAEHFVQRSSAQSKPPAADSHTPPSDTTQGDYATPAGS